MLKPIPAKAASPTSPARGTRGGGERARGMRGQPAQVEVEVEKGRELEAKRDLACSVGIRLARERQREAAHFRIRPREVRIGMGRVLPRRALAAKGEPARA